MAATNDNNVRTDKSDCWVDFDLKARPVARDVADGYRRKHPRRNNVLGGDQVGEPGELRFTLVHPAANRLPTPNTSGKTESVFKKKLNGALSNFVQQHVKEARNFLLANPGSYLLNDLCSKDAGTRDSAITAVYAAITPGLVGEKSKKEKKEPSSLPESKYSVEGGAPVITMKPAEPSVSEVDNGIKPPESKHKQKPERGEAIPEEKQEIKHHAIPQSSSVPVPVEQKLVEKKVEITKVETPKVNLSVSKFSSLESVENDAKLSAALLRDRQTAKDLEDYIERLRGDNYEVPLPNGTYNFSQLDLKTNDAYFVTSFKFANKRKILDVDSRPDHMVAAARHDCYLADVIVSNDYQRELTNDSYSTPLQRSVGLDTATFTFDFELFIQICSNASIMSATYSKEDFEAKLQRAVISTQTIRVPRSMNMYHESTIFACKLVYKMLSHQSGLMQTFLNAPDSYQLAIESVRLSSLVSPLQSEDSWWNLFPLRIIARSQEYLQDLILTGLVTHECATMTQKHRSLVSLNERLAHRPNPNAISFMNFILLLTIGLLNTYSLFALPIYFLLMTGWIPQLTQLAERISFRKCSCRLTAAQFSSVQHVPNCANLSPNWSPILATNTHVESIHVTTCRRCLQVGISSRSRRDSSSLRIISSMFLFVIAQTILQPCLASIRYIMESTFRLYIPSTAENGLYALDVVAVTYLIAFVNLIVMIMGVNYAMRSELVHKKKIIFFLLTIFLLVDSYSAVMLPMDIQPVLQNGMRLPDGTEATRLHNLFVQLRDDDIPVYKPMKIVIPKNCSEFRYNQELVRRYLVPLNNEANMMALENYKWMVFSPDSPIQRCLLQNAETMCTMLDIIVDPEGGCPHLEIDQKRKYRAAWMAVARAVMPENTIMLTHRHSPS